MADDAKVISLAERLRARAGQGSAEKSATAEPEALVPAAKGPPATAPAQPPQGDSIPVPVQLYWLFCPTCKTLEYTELAVPGGRVHNVCGTQVEEAVVDVDARAEFTVAEFNLRRLEALARLVEAQRSRAAEYQARLRKAAGKPLTGYPLTGETAQALPVAEADALGLLISRFLHDPARRFPPAESGKPPPHPEPKGD